MAKPNPINEHAHKAEAVAAPIIKAKQSECNAHWNAKYKPPLAISTVAIISIDFYNTLLLLCKSVETLSQ